MSGCSRDEDIADVSCDINSVYSRGNLWKMDLWIRVTFERMHLFKFSSFEESRYSLVGLLEQLRALTYIDTYNVAYTWTISTIDISIYMYQLKFRVVRDETRIFLRFAYASYSRKNSFERKHVSHFHGNLRGESANECSVGLRSTVLESISE